MTPVMLTGDNHATAKLIASEVGIDKFYSECMPQDKVNVIQEYRSKGHKVLMIGDGINDAPSLVSANIGVSMGDGTDVSLETADIVMMNNDLRNIPYLMKITKRMNFIVLQNVVFSILVITLLLITNLFGLVDLTYGVFGHEVSTILVILNSLRLLKSK
jgi:Cd2+/Zn2+-exporting ATPase